MFRITREMKIFTYIMIVIAIGLSVFNATKLNFDNLLEGDSLIAAITILAAACVILLLLILRASLLIKGRKK